MIPYEYHPETTKSMMNFSERQSHHTVFMKTNEYYAVNREEMASHFACLAREQGKSVSAISRMAHVSEEQVRHVLSDGGISPAAALAVGDVLGVRLVSFPSNSGSTR